MKTRYPFIVGSERRTSKLKRDIVNPFTNEVVAEIYLAGESDIEDAISSAQSAFHTSKILPSYRRAAILESISDILSTRKEELSHLMTLESGKPIMYSRSELERAIFTFKYASEEAKRIGGETIPLDLASHSEKRFGIIRSFPIGPILAITPFNFPLNLVAHKVAPCIATGNTMVLKPAPQAPLLALLLGEIILEAGAPAGMINIVPTVNELAENMVKDDRFKMLTFTGSAQVGWYLKSIAGKKKVVLELGGNAAMIVDITADCVQTAKRIALGAYGQAGQSCIKVQRIYVHEEIAKAFTGDFIAATNVIKYGNPLENDTIVGPLIDKTAADRVESWINEALQNGATLYAGGKRTNLLINPTIITNTRADMKVVCEEIFGPVVTLHTYTNIVDAVREVNNSKYGLQAGIFSNDFENIFYAYENLDVGGVVVNDFPTYRIDHMPYGGIKDSGIGREGIRYAIEEMMEKKLLVLNLNL